MLLHSESRTAGPAPGLGPPPRSTLIEVGAALGENLEIKHFGRNHDIYLDGEEVDNLLLLKEGWAYRYRLLDDGRRHIISFLISGDVIGPYTSTANHFLAVLTDSEIAWTPRKRLPFLADRSPDLFAALTNALSAELEILSEHALSLGRRNAVERMAQLLVELSQRTQKAGLSDGMSYPFPASQEIIGDSLGLSVVHVNRTLRRLREQGIALVRSGRVDIIDRPRLARLANADDLADAA